MPKLVTYKITGGSPFTLELPHNPNIEHKGGVSTGHLYLNEEEIGAIMLSLNAYGVTLEFWDMAKQTLEQEKEREVLAGKFKEETIFHNSECPECAWFDPLTIRLCGLSDWPPESIKVLLEKSHHKSHQDKCPTPQVWKEVSN